MTDMPDEIWLWDGSNKHLMASTFKCSEEHIKYTRSDLIPRPSLPPDTVRVIKETLKHYAKVCDMGCEDGEKAEKCLALLEGV